MGESQILIHNIKYRIIISKFSGLVKNLIEKRMGFMNAEKKRKRIRRTVYWTVLCGLCAAFWIRWQAAEQKCSAAEESIVMRAAEQLYESVCLMADSVAEYRAGGEWGTMCCTLYKTAVAGKQAVSYLPLDEASSATLNRFFSDAETLLNGEEAEMTFLLGELENYSVVLRGFLYRERDGYAAYSDSWDLSLSGLPYYRRESDAVRAVLPAESEKAALLDERAAREIAVRMLGGEVRLRTMVLGAEGEGLYGFFCTNACVLIRKTDGRLYRMIREHRNSAVKKDEEACRLCAVRFLAGAKYLNMEETEQYVTDNVCYFIFAEKERPESCVRIGVTMSTGTVCAFSAAEYRFE